MHDIDKMRSDLFFGVCGMINNVEEVSAWLYI